MGRQLLLLTECEPHQRVDVLCIQVRVICVFWDIYRTYFWHHNGQVSYDERCRHILPPASGRPRRYEARGEALKPAVSD